MATSRRYAPRLPPAERREQLLDAALELTVRDGYGGVTMEAVAREVGVTKPVVYDAFPNRGELLRALLQREERRALEQLGAVLGADTETGDDPDTLLADGFRAFLQAVRETPATWRLLLLPTEGTPDIVRAHVDQGRAQVEARLQELLGWAVGRGAIAPDTDVELLSHAIRALGEHDALLVLADPDRFSPERLATFTAGLLAGLTPSSDRTIPRSSASRA